ncbi:hypothetical protein KO489_02805 [Reinekea forsetii]|nr:hypothetical protein [Reinekea forsetii]
MNLVTYISKYLPASLRSKRFLLDQKHFELTSFKGDVSEWMQKYPVSEENAEIHLALAELFRRRGEFDKAVAVHEAIASANLAGFKEEEILLEMAQDYYAAGILGHAEVLLEKVLQTAGEEHSKVAFRLWLSILEREQEWGKAIALVEQFGQPGSGGIRLVNLYCEYALELKSQGDVAQLAKVLKKARRLTLGIRASLMSAELATAQNRLKESIKFYRDVLIRDPLRSDIVLPALKHLSHMTKSQEALSDFLKGLYQTQPSVRILEALIELNIDMSAHYWAAEIEHHAKQGRSKKVFDHWLDGVGSIENEAKFVIGELVHSRSLVRFDRQKCYQCGFQTDQLIWQCPQCDGWETLYSRYELKISRQTSKQR